MQTKRKSVKNLKRKANAKSKKQKQIGGSGLNAQLAALLSGKAKISNSRPEPINEDEIKELLIEELKKPQHWDGTNELIFPEKYSQQKAELKQIIEKILKSYEFKEQKINKLLSGELDFTTGNAKTYSFYALRTKYTRGEEMKIKDIPINDTDVSGVVIRMNEIRRSYGW